MNIHFVGSEGVSMKVLMRIMSAYGHSVTGSDLVLSGHDEKNIDGADTVVYTTAVGEDNIEITAARKKGLRVVERAEFLGEVARNYNNVIAVCGSHGKTTATGFLEQIFLPLNPTVHIGGKTLGENGHIGGREYFITEACEYKRSFLHIKPDVAVVLNMELDHTDYYRDEDDYVSAFKSFSFGAKKTLVFSGDAHSGELDGNVITFGFTPESYYSAQNIRASETGYSFDIYRAGKKIIDAEIKINGRHNVINALAAAAAALECGVNTQLIKEGLMGFSGVKRRFEFITKLNGCRIFSDYAHHPSEIKTTIETARSLSAKKVTVIFEPHTYSRTKSLEDRFVESLSGADRIILTPIYPARENPLEGVTSLNLVQKLISMDKKAIYFNTFCEVCRYVNDTASNGEIVVFTGAGDIEKAAHLMMKF